MKRTIEVVASFSGKINTGEYENAQPFFSLKEVLDDVDGKINDTWLKERGKQLADLCYANFMVEEQKQTARKIEKDFSNIRFYPVGDDQYPSVTSILNWDKEFYVDAKTLYLLSCEGQIHHLRVAEYISTGEWKYPERIAEARRYLKVLQKEHGEDYCIEGGDFPAFLKAFPIESMENGRVVINRELKYAGLPDFDGVPVESKEWASCGAVQCLTLFDVKRTVDAEEQFKQLAAYAKASEKDYQQLCIIPLNNKTKQGYSKPKVTKDIDSYWKMFVQARAEFKKRFTV